MRIWISMLATLGLTGFAGAQEQPDPQAAPPRQVAIDVEQLQPGVDVSAPRPAPTAVPAPDARAAETAPRTLDSLDLGTTSITGNQELPKVLYIVPWKQSDLGDLVGRPANTLLDEVLAPIDPAVFERHLEYFEALYGEGPQE